MKPYPSPPRKDRESHRSPARFQGRSSPAGSAPTNADNAPLRVPAQTPRQRRPLQGPDGASPLQRPEGSFPRHVSWRRGVPDRDNRHSGNRVRASAASASRPSTTNDAQSLRRMSRNPPVRAVLRPTASNTGPTPVHGYGRNRSSLRNWQDRSWHRRSKMRQRMHYRAAGKVSVGATAAAGAVLPLLSLRPKSEKWT